MELSSAVSPTSFSFASHVLKFSLCSGAIEKNDFLRANKGYNLMNSALIASMQP